MSKFLHIIRGIEIVQEDDKRIHYIAGLQVDADGAPNSYRLDNDDEKALDDIHVSAGWPHSSWWNVLARDPLDPSKPYVDKNGYCVSKTSYERTGYNELDRMRYLDATRIPYSVIPRIIRSRCRGVLLGCHSRITDTVDGRSIPCVTGDFSGYSIGEASDFVAKFFSRNLSPRNGDDRRRYLYEFFPDTPAVINGETFELRPL